MVVSKLLQHFKEGGDPTPLPSLGANFTNVLYLPIAETVDSARYKDYAPTPHVIERDATYPPTFQKAAGAGGLLYFDGTNIQRLFVNYNSSRDLDFKKSGVTVNSNAFVFAYVVKIAANNRQIYPFQTGSATGNASGYTIIADAQNSKSIDYAYAQVCTSFGNVAVGCYSGFQIGAGTTNTWSRVVQVAFYADNPVPLMKVNGTNEQSIDNVTNRGYSAADGGFDGDYTKAVIGYGPYSVPVNRKSYGTLGGLIIWECPAVYRPDATDMTAIDTFLQKFCLYKGITVGT